MRIGYPCINRTIGCRSERKFRLASYTHERFQVTVEENISCLYRILSWNLEHDILFFRISSDIIPFASHPVCTYPWKEEFGARLKEIGNFIRESEIRISMHPDQFIILNSPDGTIVGRSIDELFYHAELLDLMGLDNSAKIQLHVGGVYGNSQESRVRFIRNYRQLDPLIRRYLVIENDDQRFGISACLDIHQQTGIPVLFDLFHHNCFNKGEDIREVFEATGDTWKRSDGIPMVDYSTQHPEKRPGGHADHIDGEDFKRFLERSRPYDRDIMLEIKDKEASTLQAVVLAKNDPRFSLRPRSKD